MQFNIGEKVDLVYPLDIKWWEKDCYIHSKEDDNVYKIINDDGEILQVSSLYLKPQYKSKFDIFKDEVQRYLKNKEELSAFRISKQANLFVVSLMLKVEYWTIFKLTNETDFYEPIYHAYLNNKPDYSTEIKINIYCEKKKI